MNTRVLKITGVSLITAATLGCGGGGGGGDSSSVVEDVATLQAALTEIADVVLPRITAAKTTAETFTAQVETFCDELALDENASNTTVQKGWRDMMDAWQYVEMLNFGPSSDNAVLNLRDQVYSWPELELCTIDGAVVDQTLLISNNRGTGLNVAEYLLFNADLELSDGCNGAALNTTWDGYTDAQKKIARCEYTELVAAEVEADITSIETAWNGASGYYAELTTAGTTSTRYSSATEALNEVTDALFYLEDVKDLKLAEPAGIGLGNDPQVAGDPNKVESIFANNSLANLKTNLEAFKLVLENGIDTVLASVGQAAISTQMVTDIDSAIANIDAFVGTLQDSVTGLDETNCVNTTTTNRLEPACALFYDVKEVTDDLKVEFVTALSVNTPASAAGDTD